MPETPTPPTRKTRRPRNDYSDLSVVETDTPGSDDQSSVQDTPVDSEVRPDTRKGRRHSSESPSTTPYHAGVIARGLTELYTEVGTFLCIADPVLGQEIIKNAKQCAESLDELAKTNPQVRAVLLNMIKTSVLGKVIVAHAPILLAIKPVRAKMQSSMMMAHVEREMSAHMKGNGDGSTHDTPNT